MTLLEKLEIVLWANVGHHSGACCTFDAQQSVVVTAASCTCAPHDRAIHDALGTWGLGWQEQNRRRYEARELLEKGGSDE